MLLLRTESLRRDCITTFLVLVNCRNRRMDLVIDYLGVRYVVEMKIWHGKAYHEKGGKQLARYLEDYHLDKGYLLTYSFNKKKEAGVNTVTVDGKRIVEVIV